MKGIRKGIFFSVTFPDDYEELIAERLKSPEEMKSNK